MTTKASFFKHPINLEIMYSVEQTGSSIPKTCNIEFGQAQHEQNVKLCHLCNPT